MSQRPGTWQRASRNGSLPCAIALGAECSALPRFSWRKAPCRTRQDAHRRVPSSCGPACRCPAQESYVSSRAAARVGGTWQSHIPCRAAGEQDASEDGLCQSALLEHPQARLPRNNCRYAALRTGLPRAGGTFHRRPDGPWWSNRLGFVPNLRLADHTSADKGHCPFFGRRFPGSCRMGVYLDACAVGGTTLPSHMLSKGACFFLK